MNMETDPSDRSLANVNSSREKIRVWPIVSQSFAVLFRHVVPFVLLTFAVGAVVALTVNQFFFLATGTSVVFIVSYKRAVSILWGALSKVPVEAVIAMAVWLDLGGRRLSLRGSLVRAARAIPGILHRPFYVFVLRVFTVSLLRSVLNLPYHVAMILVVTSGQTPYRIGVSITTVSILGILFNTLVDSRLFVLTPVAAIERTGVLHSIRRCWRLTSRHWLQILGVLVLLGFFSAAVNIPAGLTAGYVMTGFSYGRRAGVRLLLRAVRVFIRVCWAVTAAVCYRHIRVANGESTTEQLVPSTS